MRKKSCLYIFPTYLWIIVEFNLPSVSARSSFSVTYIPPQWLLPALCTWVLALPRKFVDKNTGVIIREGGGTACWHRSCCPVNKSQHTRHRCVNKDVYSATSDQIDTVNVIVLFSIEKVTLPWMENIILINVQWVDIQS